MPDNVHIYIGVCLCIFPYIKLYWEIKPSSALIIIDFKISLIHSVHPNSHTIRDLAPTLSLKRHMHMFSQCTALIFKKVNFLHKLGSLYFTVECFSKHVEPLWLFFFFCNYRIATYILSDYVTRFDFDWQYDACLALRLEKQRALQTMILLWSTTGCVTLNAEKTKTENGCFCCKESLRDVVSILWGYPCRCHPWKDIQWWNSIYTVGCGSIFCFLF